MDELVDTSESSVFDNVLRVFLFMGAIFQVVCIFAAVFLPQQDEDESVCSALCGLMTCVAVWYHRLPVYE
jgi:Uncharacterised protein family (UPF0239)